MTPGSPTPSTKVVLPMLNLVPGGMGGSETYARELISELGANDDIDITCVVPASAAGFGSSVPEIVRPYSVRGESAAARLGGMARGLLPGREARVAIRGADVVHHPFTVPIPPTFGTPRVTTLMDVQHLDLPEFFSLPEMLFRRLAYDAAAKRADLIITISEFCRSRIIDTLSIPPERVRVAHLGVDSASFVPFDGEREEFVLYPARAWPHKNHERLFEAMRHLRLARPELRLVLTGGPRDEHGRLPEGVEHHGQVSSDELRSLYRRASALVFPSLYEGFGLPPLEAMASGCPVASATTGSLPEICGDAAVFFDATDPRDIARAAAEAIDARSRLVPLGLARMRQFTWAGCAAAHVDAYRVVSARGER